MQTWNKSGIILYYRNKFVFPFSFPDLCFPPSHHGIKHRSVFLYQLAVLFVYRIEETSAEKFWFYPILSLLPPISGISQMASSFEKHSAHYHNTIGTICLNMYFQKRRVALYFAELTQKCNSFQLASAVNDPRINKHVRLSIILHYAIGNYGIEPFFMILYIKLYPVINL